MSFKADFSQFLSSMGSTPPHSMETPDTDQSTPLLTQEAGDSPPPLLLLSTMSDHTTGNESSQDNKSKASVKQGLKCRSCHEEMSTKEALKLHTCYSIMDRTITVEGNINRKRMVPIVMEFGQVTTSGKKLKAPITKKCPAVKKTRRLSKKPNSIMLIKAQLISCKVDPEAAAEYKRSRLTPELEHGAGTLVVRCGRRVMVKHPLPGGWILDRGEFNLGNRDCKVFLGRVDAKNTMRRYVADMDNVEDIPDINLHGAGDIAIAGADVDDLASIDDSSDDSCFEITIDEEEYSVPSPGFDSHSSDHYQTKEAADNEKIFEGFSKVTDIRHSTNVEDTGDEDLVTKHIEEIIEGVVKASVMNEEMKIADQSKKTYSPSCPSISVKAMVMKARRKHNCTVRMKRLSSAEVKRWTAMRTRDGDLWSAMSTASSGRKKTKSSVSASGNSGTRLKNVVNHFRKFKEKDQKEVSGGSVNRLQTRFKIPKTSLKRNPDSSKYEDRARDVVWTGGQVMSVGGFLEKEKIETDARVEQFMEEVSGEAEFGNMFDEINVLRSKESNKIYQTEDKMELKDLEDENWDKVKLLKTDGERKKLAQEQFRNIVSSDPAVNLSFHGFRRKTVSKSESGRVVSVGCFALLRGEMKPLPGFIKIGETELSPHSAVSKKQIRLSDFAQVMKSLFYKKYAKNLGSKKASQQEFDDFKFYLSHYKTGQEETMNFLSFYQENVMLDGEQTDEVMDIENQYSTFSSYYGPAETTFCSVCEKKHKFCQ